MRLRTLPSAAACAALLVSGAFAQQANQTMPMDKPAKPAAADMKMMPEDPNKPMLSPPATANVMLGGSSLMITYNSPSMRGRTIMGGIVPYDKVWRTGANPATTLITPVALTIGTLSVPAGTYTLYTLPSSGKWQLIVNKQTGQWGTVYDQKMDLGRVPMKAKQGGGAPLEVMLIDFENTAGNRTELHIKWEKTDQYVPVELAK